MISDIDKKIAVRKALEAKLVGYWVSFDKDTETNAQLAVKYNTYKGL